MRKKKFDCVEMKRKAAEKIYQIIKDMTPEEELEYWNRRTIELRSLQRQDHPVSVARRTKKVG